jgi:hypothetical protein
VSKAAAVAPNLRAATYLKSITEKFDKAAQAEKRRIAKDSPEHAGITPSSLMKWLVDTPEPDQGTEQPAIDHFRATLKVSDPTAYPKDAKETLEAAIAKRYPRRLQREVLIAIPLAGNPGDFVSVTGKGFCRDEIIYMKHGVQRRRCAFIVIALPAGADPADMLDEAVRASKLILEHMPAITTKYADRISAAELAGFTAKATRCAENVAVRSQITCLFWLRYAWPKSLNNKAILLTFDVHGTLHHQLYIRAAGDALDSNLQGQCISILAHGGHMFEHTWDEPIDTL